MEELLSKAQYDISDLCRIVKILRSENGCPWDKEQTHKSMRSDIIEEAYEVVEAIDCDNSDMLKEELGDVLLQVVFHTDIESDKGSFVLNDVADDVCRKLIQRHPHVFGDVKVSGTDDVLKNWDNIKKQAKNQTYTDTLTSVPKVFPSLMRAQKLGKRAGRAGLDFQDAQEAYERLNEEVSELGEAINCGDITKISDELGDVIFSCVNTARFLGLDAEQLMRDNCEKFIARFAKVEDLTRQNGIDMKSLSIDELNSFWERAKGSK